VEAVAVEAMQLEQVVEAVVLGAIFLSQHLLLVRFTYAIVPFMLKLVLLEQVEVHNILLLLQVDIMVVIQKYSLEVNHILLQEG
jgi:hypothetical protein